MYIVFCVFQCDIELKKYCLSALTFTLRISVAPLLVFLGQFADRYFPYSGATFIEFLEISFREINLFHSQCHCYGCFITKRRFYVFKCMRDTHQGDIRR